MLTNQLPGMLQAKTEYKNLISIHGWTRLRQRLKRPELCLIFPDEIHSKGRGAPLFR